MSNIATRSHLDAALHVRPGAVRRGLVAGSAWGVFMGALLTASSAWSCGTICVPDAALTTAFSIAAGVCTMGPLAAFGARPA
jgi:hypothetical protein